MELFSSFILSVVASVAANYICKWLDKRNNNGSQPKA